MDGPSGSKRGQSSSVFLAEEFYRFVSFYGFFKENISDVLGHDMKGIAFQPDVQFLSFLANHYSEMIDKEELRISEIRKGVLDIGKRLLSDKEMNRIRNMVSFLCFDFKDAFMVIFQCFVAMFWNKKIFKDELFSESDYECRLYHFCVSLTNSDSKGVGEVRKRVTDFLESNKPNQIEVLKYDKDIFTHMELENPVYEFFKLLCGLTSQESANGEVFLQMPWEDVLKKLKYVKELYQHVTALGPFIELRFDPPMSSGQYNLHSFYARLYEHFLDIRESIAGYDGSDFSREYAGHLESGWVVIMDEVEVTLHPEWQRTIILDLLTVFGKCFKGFNVHFIFMTHSPIILSDIPKGNVVLLNENHFVVDAHRQKAFAANIFELFKDSFLLEDGQMGKFAAAKVNELLRKLKSKRRPDISKEDLKVAKLIDDPFISHYVWNRLGRIVIDTDMPDDDTAGDKL